jgi:integrase
MAADFLQACDDYQLRLFAPLVLYGLRPSELCYLFGNPDDRHGLDVVCRPELDYRTKGGRDKRLPLVPPLPELLYGNGKGRPSGLLYLRRCAVEGSGRIRLLASTREELVAEFERRCKQDRVHTAADRRRVRDQVLRDAGGMNYDHIATEFQKLHRQLKWPREATLKDFRHLCASCLENAGVPEHYRKYLLGHSTGRAPIVTYTHLNRVSEHYQRAAGSEFEPLLDAIFARSRELAASDS